MDVASKYICLPSAPVLFDGWKTTDYVSHTACSHWPLTSFRAKFKSLGSTHEAAAHFVPVVLQRTPCAPQRRTLLRATVACAHTHRQTDRHSHSASYTLAHSHRTANTLAHRHTDSLTRQRERRAHTTPLKHMLLESERSEPSPVSIGLHADATDHAAVLALATEPVAPPKRRRRRMPRRVALPPRPPFAAINACTRKGPRVGVAAEAACRPLRNHNLQPDATTCPSVSVFVPLSVSISHLLTKRRPSVSPTEEANFY